MFEIQIDPLCEIPEPHVTYGQKPGHGIEPERFVEPPRAPLKGEHGNYWPLFTVDGAPVEPERAVALIESGEATLVDAADAQAKIEAFEERILHRDVRLWAPVNAHKRLQRAERAERAVAAFEENESLYFSAAEAGKILGVHADTVKANAGHGVIPAPIKVGKQYRFRKEAVLRLVAA